MKNPWEDGNISPEQRTENFFAQDYADLASSLVGMTIAVPGSQNRIVIAQTDPFERETNKRPPYKSILDMPAGRLAAIDFPFRKAVLPLVTALQGEEGGACVRIVAADIFSNGSAKRIKKGADLLTHLGIETGSAPRLAFRDPSNTLYVEISDDKNVKDTQISPQSTAGEELDKFMDGFGI